MASLQTEPPPPHPTGKTRQRSALFIAVFVALQFLIPLTYLVREDASDERFTWRSLAEPNPVRCESHAELIRADGARENVPLEALVHEDWVRYVQRGRQTVVDALLVEQCEAAGVERVELVNRCEGESGTRRYSRPCRGEPARAARRAAAR